jgi:hypothetical protein
MINSMKEIALKGHLSPGLQVPEVLKLLLAAHYLTRMRTLLMDVEEYQPVMGRYRGEQHI